MLSKHYKVLILFIMQVFYMMWNKRSRNTMHMVIIFINFMIVQAS